uniref:Serum response factor homolog n=1 Tax=Plectus sambesii TaxID=2011161 RepID=A0A914WX96_9BILA
MASYGSLVPGESCFNLNFSNPGGSGPAQSLLLTPNIRHNTSPKNSGGSSLYETGLMTPGTFTAALATPNIHGLSSSSSNKQSSRERDNNSSPASSGASNKRKMNDSSSHLPNGKKTKGRVKIKMEYIGNKLRRYTTFSKRKTGIMKKAYELSTLTGTQVMLLVASETGHVYTFATKKLQPMITSEAGKGLIQTCLNTPDSAPGGDSSAIAESVDAVAAGSSEFSFDPPSSKRRKGDDMGSGRNSGLPTMVRTTRSPDAGSGGGSPADSPGGCNSGFVDDSDDSSSDGEGDDQNETSNDMLQQTLQEALRVASQHQQQAQQMVNQVNSQANALNALFPNGVPFGLIPGLGSAASQVGQNGAVMYQMPQGVVYTTNNSDGTQNAGSNGGGLFLNVPTTSDGSGNGQFITIPIPVSLQQLVANGMGHSLGASEATVSQSS